MVNRKWAILPAVKSGDKGEYQILLQSYALFYSDARPFCFKILAYAIFIFILAAVRESDYAFFT